MSDLLYLVNGNCCKFHRSGILQYSKGIFFLHQTMNFTILNRNSTAGPIYTDRPSFRESQVGEHWRKSSEHHHLNPSKSKVNVRSFLNKTGEGFSLSHPNLDNVRGSGFLANPPKPNQQSK